MSNDQSHLDRKYFIDKYKYNCPYCNRKSITYSVNEEFSFDWSNDRRVFGYLVECGGDDCSKISLHLSNFSIEIRNEALLAVHQVDEKNGNKTLKSVNDLEIDDLFFYHQPTTFFTLDSRVNEKIRKLISEAEGCSKMNYLVGASGCLRKAIYELLEIEVPSNEMESDSIGYEERVKTLKIKYPTIPPEYFDALSNIQGMTSEQLHEGDWKPWTQDQFRFLVETAKEVLTEMYVRPQEKASVLQKILALQPQKVTKKIENEEQETKPTS